MGKEAPRVRIQKVIEATFETVKKDPGLAVTNGAAVAIATTAVVANVMYAMQGDPIEASAIKAAAGLSGAAFLNPVVRTIRGLNWSNR